MTLDKDSTELTMHGLAQVTVNAFNHIIRMSKNVLSIFFKKIQYLVPILNPLKEKYKVN